MLGGSISGNSSSLDSSHLNSLEYGDRIDEGALDNLFSDNGMLGSAISGSSSFLHSSSLGKPRSTGAAA